MSAPNSSRPTSSQEVSRAPTSPTPESGSFSPDQEDSSGTRWREPFAFFDREQSSWRTCQASLLPSESSSPTWPRQGMWDAGYAFEHPTSARPTEESASSSLLPTPSAQESTPTDSFVEESRQAGILPGERLYLPGRKWHAQRTLSRIAPALLPTPSAWLGRRPENAKADPERAASRAHEGVQGQRSFELTDALALLPTPTSADAGNARNKTSGRQPGSRHHHTGTTLPDVFFEEPTSEHTEKPWRGGPASSGESHPGQLTIEDA